MSSALVQNPPATKGSIRISTPRVAASSRTCSIGGSSILAAPGSSWSDRKEACVERGAELRGAADEAEGLHVDETDLGEAGERAVRVGGERVADGVELDGQCSRRHEFSPVRRVDLANSDQRSELRKSYTQNPTEGRLKA
jgi:hypothetical protein